MKNYGLSKRILVMGGGELLSSYLCEKLFETEMVHRPGASVYRPC